VISLSDIVLVEVSVERMLRPPLFEGGVQSRIARLERRDVVVVISHGVGGLARLLDCCFEGEE
jgi:hypothetical protein